MTNNGELQYLDVMRDILENGEEHDDRTGTGTLSTFGQVVRHDFSEGFPLLTTKKMHTKSIIHELLWFINGDTNIKYLQDNGVRIWNEWADENGNLGPIYGKQMRNFFGVDQLQNIVDQIKSSPGSRRHVMTLWNPAELPYMKLPPCHGVAIQFNIKGDYIDLATYQRSCDWFLGVPFNIASYSALLYIVGWLTGKKPRSLFYAFGDAHIYKNHIEQCKEQLSRDPMTLPKFEIDDRGAPLRSLNYVSHCSFGLVGYKPHPAIKAEVSV